jgi:hypothetical protein
MGEALDRTLWRTPFGRGYGQSQDRLRNKLSTVSILTPLSRVLLEKLTGLQLISKFPAFYASRRFIAVFTTASHLSLFWSRTIQFMHPSPIPWLQDPFYYHPPIFTQVFQVISFLTSPHHNSACASPVPHTCHMTHPSHSSWFGHPNNVRWKIQFIKLPIM